MEKILCQIKPYIQPFERKLAIMELSTLTNSDVVDVHNSLLFEVESYVSAKELASRLSYWEVINNTLYTIQSQRESTVNIIRNGIPIDQIHQLVPFRDTIPLPNRRCLRYGTHGIHEYRGKFFPQLVRSLSNIADVKEKGIIADPMIGSGTTAVETVLLGCHSIGMDLNPLSLLISNTKCALLTVSPVELETTYSEIHDKLLNVEPTTDLIYFSTLSEHDRTYLRSWFSEQVIQDLDQIVTNINVINNKVIRDFMLISLSNILRKVSWQKVDDLRVRKEIREDIDIYPIREFLEEIGRSVRTVLPSLFQNQGELIGTWNIQEANAADITLVWKNMLGKVDAVITSPPYATALPYLDTDRLSLYYLGLLSRSEHRKRDVKMIGNREISEKARITHWQNFNENKFLLPNNVVDLIELIERLNSHSEVGFRRKNLPALLARYFFEMRKVMIGIHALLKPGAPAFFVVGNNHTIAGGQRIDIQTGELLVDIAESIGLKLIEVIPMEMLVSRDIYKKNAITREVILHFRRS